MCFSLKVAFIKYDYITTSITTIAKIKKKT